MTLTMTLGSQTISPKLDYIDGLVGLDNEKGKTDMRIIFTNMISYQKRQALGKFEQT